MNELILIMIMLATIAYVAQPYWHKQTAGLRPAGNPILGDLLEKRDSLLVQIKEVEFDHEVGKVSDEDFVEVNARYREEVIAIMRRIDVLTDSNGSSQRARKHLLKAPERTGKNGDRASDLSEKIFCSQCGSAANLSDAFCSNCGHQLQPPGEAS